MSDTHLEPAKSIIEVIGIDKVSDLTGAHVSRVYRWMYPKERGGTGGLIPFKHVPALLSAAKAKGVDISADDFLPRPAPRSKERA